MDLINICNYLVNDRNQLVIGQKKNLISKSVFDPIIAEWGKRTGYDVYGRSKQRGIICIAIFLFYDGTREVREKYELRIFYLNGKMYPMAIFLKRSTKTSWVCRNYNWEKPNRMSIKLNVDLKEKNTQN